MDCAACLFEFGATRGFEVFCVSFQVVQILSSPIITPLRVFFSFLKKKSLPGYSARCLHLL